MAYKSKGPSMKQGGTFMSKHNSSYMHKQNLLNDMPVDNHAGNPLNQTRVSPDRKNKKGQTQSEILENSLNKLNKQIDLHNKTQFTSQDRLDASKRMIDNLDKEHLRKIDSVNTANKKMDKYLQDVVNNINKGNYPGSLQK